MSDLISRQAVYDALDNIKIPRNASWYPYYHQALTAVSKLPPVQPDFDITVKINKAYDDGYEAGYLQGRHDWGDWDE